MPHFALYCFLQFFYLCSLVVLLSFNPAFRCCFFFIESLSFFLIIFRILGVTQGTLSFCLHNLRGIWLLIPLEITSLISNHISFAVVESLFFSIFSATADSSCVCVCVYIYKFSPRGFSEPVYTYIQGQTVEGLRKSARAAHILRRNLQPIRSALSGRNRDRPQHRDHYPIHIFFKQCNGTKKGNDSFTLGKHINFYDFQKIYKIC